MSVQFFRVFNDGFPLVNEKVKYQSNKCNYQATTNNNLAEHYRGVHEGVKYLCGQCDKEFSQREHQRAHAGVKYICQQCNHQTTSQENIAQHQRTVHEGVKHQTSDPLLDMDFTLTTPPR